MAKRNRRIVEKYFEHDLTACFGVFLLREEEVVVAFCRYTRFLITLVLVVLVQILLQTLLEIVA